MNESDNDIDVIDDNVDNDDSEYEEESSEQEYKNTPYTGKLQQDYFGNVDKTPIDDAEESAVTSTRKQPYSPC